MPSVSNYDFGGDSSNGIPWKPIGIIAVIVSALGYGMYQFAQIRPHPTPLATKLAVVTPDKNRGDEFKTVLDKLDLTSEQKSQVSTIAAGTTNPVEFRREVNKILTPDQHEKAKAIRGEIADANRARQERNKARTAKYYPGGDLAIAKEGNKQIRERTEARSQAAAAQKNEQTTAAKTP